jgi:hypothetical protein
MSLEYDSQARQIWEGRTKNTMTTKIRTVKFAGVSITTEEDGTQSAAFHTSNNEKYAIWSKLPTNVGGSGRAVAYFFFAMPPGTEKLGAVKLVLEKHTPPDKQKWPPVVIAMLQEKLADKEPKKKAKKTVTVEISKEEAAAVKATNLTKLKAAAEKRKTATAA